MGACVVIGGKPPAVEIQLAGGAKIGSMASGTQQVPNAMDPFQSVIDGAQPALASITPVFDVIGFGMAFMETQIFQLKVLGSIIDMIPGMGGAAKQAQQAIDRGELSHIEAIIRAMTPAERSEPGILNASRRRRIARGSGRTLPEVNRLVKQFGEMQKMMKMMRSRGGKLPSLPMGPP